MERIIKRIIFCTMIFIISSCGCKGEEFSGLSSLITTQNITYEQCTRVFNTDNIKLYYLTIASINANKFTIDEVQSKMGYILFTAAGKQFLASVSNVNTNQGMLKITPVDNNYYFQPGIILNIYKYIDINLNKNIEFYTLK